MAALDDLLDDLFDGLESDNDPLSIFQAEFESWLRGSRRFRDFVIAYRGKIRTKIKQAVKQEAGSVKDVRAELQIAALLLREERFTLEYEKYAAMKQRGPDFTVTYRTHTPFNVEVRRIRSVELEDADEEARIIKLMAVLCDKVGQMPPNILNVLWLTAERELTEANLSRAVTTLRQLAESKNEAFFTRRGFQSAIEFLRQYRQLGAIVLHSNSDSTLWTNPLAQHRLPADLVTAIRRVSAMG
ncbi:MAG: hypothetical protein U0670_15685 [Anaerolineae bacterium]